MCSNCSGDDPQPESFALFDVSSLRNDAGFANVEGWKRKRYRTGRLFAGRAKAALMLAIRNIRRGAPPSRIIASVDRGSFVNLNSRSSTGEYPAKSGNVEDADNLIEIRVSSDAIIEVFASDASDENTRTSRGVPERKYFSTWEESFAQQNDLRRMLSSFRRKRRLKYFVAYGAFATVAALALWCAVR